MSIRDLAPWNWGKKNEVVHTEGRPEDAFRELTRRMNSLFDDFRGASGFLPATERLFGSLETFAPKVELKESDTEVAVNAEVPGLKEKVVDISLANGVLTLKGEKKSEKKSERDGVTYSECTYGSFHRAIQLPCDVDEDKVKAEFRNGVLSVTMPKTPEARQRSRRIEVRRG